MAPTNTKALTRALLTLQEAVIVHSQSPEDLFVRDALIQRFEYTYELAWKTLKRFMEIEMGEQEADHWSKRDLFRSAAEKGLISDPIQWFGHLEARSLTSHTYNPENADKVAKIATVFADDAERLLANLNQSLNGDRFN